jgi:hypothetical protein
VPPNPALGKDYFFYFFKEKLYSLPSVVPGGTWQRQFFLKKYFLSSATRFGTRQRYFLIIFLKKLCSLSSVVSGGTWQRQFLIFLEKLFFCREPPYPALSKNYF